MRLVGERAPAREQLPRAGASASIERATPGGRGSGHRRGPAEALLLDLPEDDRARAATSTTSTTSSACGSSCDSVRDCYAALGVVHSLWKPMPGRFKDYIAMPKFNMYQSLHTTVIGPEGKPVEVQIRTHEMHRAAEYGDRGALAVQGRREVRRQARARRPRLAAPARSSGSARPRTPASSSSRCATTSRSTEVFVFTPKGDVIALPAGSTPVDFAYAVHTEVGPPLRRRAGQRPAGAAGQPARQRRRGRGVHLQGRGRRSQPRLAHLRAQPTGAQQDPAWFSKRAPRGGDRAGKDCSLKAMRRRGCRPAAAVRRARWRPWPRTCASRTSMRLYTAIGEGRISAADGDPPAGRPRPGARQRPRMLPRRSPRSITTMRQRSDADPGVARHRSQLGDVWVKLANCCTPVPGDDIMGFVTRGSGVSVHRTDCTNVGLAAPAGRAHHRGAVGAVAVVGVPGGHPGRGARPAPAALRRHPGAVRRARQHPVGVGDDLQGPHRDVSAFTFEMGDPKHLGSVLRAVRNVEGVYDVYRV